MQTLPFDPFARAEASGHRVTEASFHVNPDGSVDHGVTVAKRRGRMWFLHKPDRMRPDGSRLICWALALLILLGLGLLAVSYAAQFAYVMGQRHQEIASAIEAGCLDVGLCILSLLALGLSRKGLPSSVERALIVVVAVASAAMNYAAADTASPRSVLAFVLPPLFLAVVVDRTVATIRRHVLGMQDARSPWAAVGRVALYVLRLLLAPVSAPRGLRRWLLDVTPLPSAGASSHAVSLTASAPAAAAAPVRPAECKAITRAPRAQGGDTKTGRFLALVIERYGQLAELPEARVSAIATELAGEVALNTGAARKALRRAVLAARDGSRS